MQLPSSAVLARRKQLQGLKLDPKNTHAGLALNRYLEAHKPADREERANMKVTPEENHLENVTQIQASAAYRNAFARWEGTIRALAYRKVEAISVSPLAVGLGNESPLEVGLTVHQTYGMPVIPGSAIKGMCRRGALRLKAEGKMDDKQLNVLFGDTKSASCFVFWDAWYNPNSVDGCPFHRDVITVHHQKYYQKGSAWPTDFDDPTPVPFLIVKPGAEFLFAISAPNEEWGNYAIELLKWCLQNIGIGGKTNAGYGYFKPLEAEGAGENLDVATSTVKAIVPPNSVVAAVKSVGDKWVEVQIQGEDTLVKCTGLNPAGLGLIPGSIILVEPKRDKKTKRILSAAYRGRMQGQ